MARWRKAKMVKGAKFIRRIRCHGRRGPPPSEKTHRGRVLDRQKTSKECYEILRRRGR